MYDSSSQYAASHTEGVVLVYKQDEEYQVAVYNASKEQTLEVSTDKIQGFKKFDKLGITTDLGASAQLTSPAIFISAKEKQNLNQL